MSNQKFKRKATQIENEGEEGEENSSTKKYFLILPKTRGTQLKLLRN